MSDFSSIPIPPRNIGGIDPAQKKQDSTQKAPGTDAPSFQDSLKQALGNMSEQAKEVSNTQPSYEDANKAMEAAKNAYNDSLHAQQLMQSLMNKIDPSGKGQTSEE